MQDCVFCKIIAKEIPCHLIAENEHFMAFLDISPKSTGHTLVIPKIHYRWVYDVPNFGDYFEFAKLVILKLETNLSPEYVSILTLGEEVAHAHIQLIPKFKSPTPSETFENITAKINS